VLIDGEAHPQHLKNRDARQGAEKARKWIILNDGQNLIASGEPDDLGVKGRSQGGAAAMPDASLRNEEAAMSPKQGAKTEVHVLAVCEKIFVKVSNVIEDGPAVQRGRTASAQHCFDPVVLTLVELTLPQAESAASQKHFVASAVQPRGIGPLEEFGDRHRVSGVLLQGSHEERQAIRLDLGIVVEEENVRTLLARREAAIKGCCRPFIPGNIYSQDSRGRRPARKRRALRSVVDDHDSK